MHRVRKAVSPFSIHTAQPDELGILCAIDEEASLLFPAHGIKLDLSPEHEFARAEQARWLRAAERGRVFVAVDAAEARLGFAALDLVDGEPYLEQLAVRAVAMRRGIGAALLARAEAWAKAQAGSALWLTTYSHLPFNRPYYERHGYLLVAEEDCGPGILHHLAEQRRYLPAPAERIAMRRQL
jgi:GNAT superfamily N-acetyltransferase